MYKDLKIIHLTRENCIRTIVSLDIAFKLDPWGTSTEDKDKQLIGKKVWLETSNLICRIEQVKDYEALTRNRFKDRRVLGVEYKKLIGKPEETFQSIGEYLGVNDIDSTKITITK